MTSCLADCGLLELVEGEGTGSVLYICDNDEDNSSLVAVALPLWGLVAFIRPKIIQALQERPSLRICQ